MNKFEQLLDYIVNEEKEKAEELFHEIVVEKSRSIYENLIAEESEEDEEEDEGMEEAREEEDDEGEEDLEEEFGMDDDAGEEGGMGGDATDNFNADTADTDGPGAEGEEEGGEEGAASAEDVQDLADALEELKAEFEKLMAGEKHEEEENPDIHGGNLDDFGDDGKPMDDEEGDEEEDEDEGMNRMESRSNVREYTEKVGAPYGSGNGISNKSEQGDGKAGPINANPKNRPSGGNVSAHNIAQGQTASDSNIKGGEGLVGGVKGKFTSPNTHNVDGVKSGIKTVTKQGAGYPGNNKTAGPVGSGSGDKAGQTSVTGTKSIVDHKQG
jgi:hypothetical protein